MPNEILLLISPVNINTSCCTRPIELLKISISISLILIPSINISPFCISKYLPIKFNIEDLPAPVAPTKATFSPLFIVKLTSFNI